MGRGGGDRESVERECDTIAGMRRQRHNPPHPLGPCLPTLDASRTICTFQSAADASMHCLAGPFLSRQLQSLQAGQGKMRIL